MRRHLATAALLLFALTACADDAPLHFAGVVLYPDGSPAAGAKVWLTAWRSGEALLLTETPTDAVGRFRAEWERTPEDADVQPAVCVHAPGYGLAWTGRMVFSDPELWLVLEPEAPISGIVRGPGGDPLPGVRPVIDYVTRSASFDPDSIGELSSSIGLPAQLQEMLVSETDANGVFTIRNLPAGIGVKLSAQQPGCARARALLRSPSLPGAEPEEVRLTRSGTIRGRVYRAETREPLVAVCVYTTADQGLSATTDEHGNYEIAGVPQGLCSVLLHEDPTEFTAPAVTDVAVRSGAVTDGVDIEVIPGLEIRGTVTARDTGEPMAGALILCNSPQQPSLGLGWPTVRTAPDGTYSLRAPRGEIRMLASSMPAGWLAEGRPGLNAVTFTLTEANAPYTVDFRAVRFSPMRGRVVDGSGLPVPHARVLSVSDLLCPLMIRTTADAQGRFECGEPAMARILAAYRGNDMTRAPVVVDASRDGETTLRLSPAIRPTVIGRVVGTDGNPLAGASVRADLRDTSTRMGDVDDHWRYSTYANAGPDGRFALRSCWPGMDWNVRVTMPGYGEGAIAHEPLRDGESTDLGDIALEPADLIVNGIVVDEAGQPVTNVPVRAGPAGPGLSRRPPSFLLGKAYSGADGRFRITHLPREQVRVTADPNRYDGVAVFVGPENPEGDITLRVISRDDQVLFTHVLPTPLEVATEAMLGRVVELYRFKAFEGHEFGQYLGLSVVVDQHAARLPDERAWVCDDQGRWLEDHSIYIPSTGRRHYVFSLPEAGVKTLARVVIGVWRPDQLHTWNAALGPMQVFDPVVSGQHIAVLQSAELADEFIRPRDPAEAQPGKGPHIRARVYL
ncbi:MAG TPA: hypothetical protein DGT21_26205, partial [Armatimonadetes bacterium]|nr:hypothetical protein [Armatimonadota bacterium]